MESKWELVCGVDIGGTFTDSVLLSSDGRVVYGKALTSYNDGFVSGFFHSIEAAGEQLGLSLEEVFEKLSRISHGSTIATNIVAERNGSKVGLITTKGHEDTVIMMRGLGRVAGETPENILKVVEIPKPNPLVDRSLIKGVTERIDSNGDIVVALNEDEIRRSVQDLVSRGVEAIAISFLWSIKNPIHELRAREIIQEMFPNLFVTCGHEVTQKLGEYERTVAVVVNAYVGPTTSRYLEKLQKEIHSRRSGVSFFIMQCHGGMFPSIRSRQLPVLTIGSGPVGGVMGCVSIAEELGYKNIICTDMGGTTFDVGLIVDGQPLTSEQSIVDKFFYNVPNVQIKSIGAGGGSIAWVDPYSGGLRVGPQSAKANPGPACYGLGGEEPTVTDADLLLGYIDPNTVFGTGRGLRLNKELAEQAVSKLAASLGIITIEAAQGIVDVANAKMANLIESEVVGHGLDPREFVVVSYGGAGPVHAASYAKDLGINTVIIPGEVSSVWSAYGISISDIRYEAQQEVVLLSPFHSADLNTLFSELENNMKNIVYQEVGEEVAIEFKRYVKMRFNWQKHSLEVPLASQVLDKTIVDRMVEDYTNMYEERYGSASILPDTQLEIESIRSEAIVRVWKPKRKLEKSCG
ncbi:hydantoinase/oxoprolinase family protein [Geobacillus zalihae]|uniref:hydantoinase/oxoprolinase family protein n=1 Tax=Geobacillus zalihae TaxID=213419 RepID=UPI0016803593|nr:hydantoinase/oxoprolinase family protein [Geobacillus zalihae]QNU25932.1 hydantoinase/oxoprolinase family protein [Geobacillus zalihae]